MSSLLHIARQLSWNIDHTPRSLTQETVSEIRLPDGRKVPFRAADCLKHRVRSLSDWCTERYPLNRIDPARHSLTFPSLVNRVKSFSGDSIRPMQSVLETLHEYYRAFSGLELNAIVWHFCEPCMSIGPQGVFSARTRQELASAFAPLIEGLRARGYGRSAFAESHVTILSEATALVRGVAVRYRMDGPEMERVQISYLMHLTGTEWKIAVMILPS